MKKIIALIIGLTMAVLVSCVPVYAGWITDVNSYPFVVIDGCDDYDIVYHKATRVMYVEAKGEYNRGVFTLLVNADGSPMIYGG